jgi:hypothetical protein
MSRVDLEHLRNQDAVSANLHGLVLAELRDAREALELVKRDGHDQHLNEDGQVEMDPSVGCLSCEAVADYERRWGREARP